MAALDLGSNTFLCLIAEVEKTKSKAIILLQIYSDEVQMVRLGQDVDKTKLLQPEALLRAKKCLSDFKRTIDIYKPEKILAMATSAARDAENKEELISLCEELSIPLEIIAGDKEAQITYFGAISGQVENKKRLIVDIGGGSTELIIGDLTKIQFRQSLNIGCVRLTEKLMVQQPTPESEVLIAEKIIQESMESLTCFSEVDEILAVAGTPTSLVAAQLGVFDQKQIEGFALSFTDLQGWKKRLQASSLEEKIKMGFPKGRADVMLVGVLILLQVLMRFKKDKLIVSTRGVRHGIALEMAHRFLA